jgi:hypothetical protein
VRRISGGVLLAVISRRRLGLFLLCRRSGTLKDEKRQRESKKKVTHGPFPCKLDTVSREPQRLIIAGRKTRATIRRSKEPA